MSVTAQSLLKQSAVRNKTQIHSGNSVKLAPWEKILLRKTVKNGIPLSTFQQKLLKCINKQCCY